MFGLKAPDPDALSVDAFLPPAIATECLDSIPPALDNLSVVSWGTLDMERKLAQQLLTHLQSGIPLVIVGDSKFLVDCCLGRALAKGSSIVKLLDVAQEALKVLLQRFSVKTYGSRELLAHTPRKDNSAADAAANRALDGGSFEDFSSEEVQNFISALVQDGQGRTGLMFSFDGASRGNPGKASHGNCAWWGVWINDSFHSRGQLFSKGSTIGIQTNNVAEARGLTTAAKAALHFFFWILESCSRAAVRNGH